MKSTIVTGVLSLMALAAMTLSANAQFPLIRGVARTGVRVGAPGVDVNVGPGVAVNATGVVVARPGLAMMRTAWIGRPLLSSSVTASAAMTSSAVMTDSVAYANQTIYSEPMVSGVATTVTSGAVYGTPVYSAPAYSTPVYSSTTMSSGATYGGSASYSSSASYSGGVAASSSVVTHATPVYGAAVNSGVVVSRPAVGVGVGGGAVNVNTRRVGVFVGR